ncbi:MAG: peptide-methionine (S)-S-oxide reductase MsrA, partial [Chloroherpetonaceae bacterium]|nr:peptide-methionine (S)-S-oxide reductase MsrA [Chloroherpetonaceae bacterium]
MQVFVLISLLFASFVLYSEAQTKPENALTMSQVTNGQTEVMTVGGGCFWCVEAVFQRVEGVLKVESGYAGGTVPNPTYQQVCTGTTGHAEVVQVTFDPKKISYKELLEIFFRTHDPTTPNRQGNDVGPQYRSIILYHSEAQRQIAEEVIRETNAAKIWRDPIVTEVVPFTVFYKA